MQDTAGRAWIQFLALIQRGSNSFDCSGSIVAFAVHDELSFQHVQGCDTVNDLLSPKARRTHGFCLHTIDLRPRRDSTDPKHHRPAHSEPDYLEDTSFHARWQHIPDQGAFRIDFSAWRLRWDDFHRRIIDALAAGTDGQTVCRKSGFRKSCYSNYRARYRQDWQQFTANPSAVAT